MSIVMRVLSVFCLFAFTAAHAQSPVESGQTNVALNIDLLESAAGLTLAGASGVIAPGQLGASSVAFPINSRTASPATTFEYNAATFPTLGSFSGVIEHTGSVTLTPVGTPGDSSDDVELGNFTIGFDQARITGDASGFFVQDNITLNDAVFDIQVLGIPTQTPNNLSVEGNLLIAPELADALGVTDDSLDLVDIGDALVVAAVPEPGSVILALLGSVGLVWGYRRVR